MEDNLHNGGIANSLMKAWLSSFLRPRQDELFRDVFRQVRNLNLPFSEVQRAMCQLTRKTSVPIRKLSCSQRDPLTRKKKRRRRIIIDSDSDENGNDYKTNIHISDAHDHMEESNALPQSSFVGVPISNPNIVEVAEIIDLVDSDEEIQESPTKNIHLCRKQRFAKFFGSDSEDETDTIKLSEKSVSCVLIKDCDSDCSDELCVNERVKRKNKKLKLKNSDITLCAVEVKEEVLASDVQNENTISCQKNENKLTKSGVSEHISTIIQEKSYPSPTEVLKNVIIIVDSPENSPVMIDEEKYISDECLQKNELENKLRREHNQDVQGVSQAENIQRNSPGAELENSSSTLRGLIEQVSTSESLADSALQKNDNSGTTSISEKQITSGGENQQEATVTSSGLPLSPQETCPIGGPRTGQIWVKDNRSLGISENWNASNLNQTKDQIAISALSSKSDVSGFDQESIKCGEDAVNLISEFASKWNKKEEELKALILDNDVVSDFRKKILAAEKQTLVTYIQENVVVIFKKLVEKIQSVEKTEELIRLHISKRETSKGLIPHFNAIWKNFIYLHREARPPETEGSVSHDSSSQTFVSDVANACADARVSLIDSNNLLTIEPQRSKRESVGTVSHSKQWYQIAELNTPHTQSGQSRPFTTMSDHLPSVPSPAVDFSLSMSNPSVSQQRTSSSRQQLIQNSQMQMHNSQSIDLRRNERKQQSGRIEEQLLHQQNTSNIIDESVVQQEPNQNQGSNQQSHFPETRQLQTVQAQNVLSNQGPQQQQLVERNQLHQQQLGQSYFISHMRQTQAQVRIPVRCQAQQQESCDSASQHQVLRSMSQDQIQPHNQQLILQSIQMLEQEMKQLKERYKLLKLQYQHNPQLEGEQQKIVNKLITLSLQRQLQLAQLLPQQQQQVQGAQLPQQQQQVQGVQLPQQQQQVQGAQLPQQQQQVQGVQLPQQEQHVQRVQLPQQQQHVQTVQLPQQQQHVQRVQLPQQQQHVQRVQLPQQQQQVQGAQLPQQQQQVQGAQLPQQQQRVQSLQLPQQQQRVQRVQLPQQQQRVQGAQLPQQQRCVQGAQLPQQQQQVQGAQLPQQLQQTQLSQQWHQQLQQTQLPQQQQQMQGVQLPQQQQHVQRVQLPQQQQHVQRVQLPQQQQQVLGVQLPQQQQQLQQTQLLQQQQQVQGVQLPQQQQQSIQMLEQEIKRLMDRSKLLKSQYQHNPQLEGELRKIHHKLKTLHWQRQLQLAQLLPQQQQQVQGVQLPQQQQQVQGVQLPQQQQRVQGAQLQQQLQQTQLSQQWHQQLQQTQLPQQQQHVQGVQLPQQQQQVQGVQLPQQQQQVQQTQLSQQQQQQDLQRARFSQQQQQEQQQQRAQLLQQQQQQQAQLPQQQQRLPQLQLKQQQPQLQPQLKQSLQLQHLKSPRLPAGAEVEKQQQPQSQPQQQYPRSLQEPQHPYARLHHQLDQQHLQQSPQITQQQEKVQPLEQKRQDVYLLQQPHKQLLIVENKRRITSDCGESWCVPDHEKQKQSVSSLQSVSPQTVTNTIVPPTSAVQKCSMTPVSNALAQNLQSSYSVSSESSSRSELNLGILLQSSSCSGTHQSSVSSAISELSLSNLLKSAGTSSSSGSHQSRPSSAMVKNQLQLPPPNPSHSFSTDSSQTLPTILELSMPSSKTSTVMPEMGVSSLSNSVRVISNEILSEVSESDQNEIREVIRVKEVNKQLLQECKNVEKVMEGTDKNLEIANVRPSVLRIHENGGDIETRTECSRQMPGSVKLVFDNDLRQGGKPEGLNDGRTEDLIEMQLVDTGTKNVISTMGDTCSVIKPMDISNEIDSTVKENKSQFSRQNDLVEIAVNAISENKPFTQKENNGKDSQSSETEFQVGNKITIIDHNESSSSIIGLGSRSEEKLPPEVHGTEHEEETDIKPQGIKVRSISLDSGYKTPSPFLQDTAVQNKKLAATRHPVPVVCNSERQPICAVCQEEAHVVCSQCRAICYCNEVCQQKHWYAGHYEECVDDQ